jgi:hypothetical protein
MTYTRIEQLIRRLDERFLARLTSYLEFLLWEQKHKAESPGQESTSVSLLNFAGDAPYPDVVMAEEEFYEQ